MHFKFVVPVLSILVMTLTAPARAQYAPIYGPGYDGPAYGEPVYRTHVFRDVYPAPRVGPFLYGDGWVPEPIFDHSRTGGIDPNIRPSD